MNSVRPKKHLGQHFLRDENIAAKIANALIIDTEYDSVVEIGPGTGVLTKYLLEKHKEKLVAFEVDGESKLYLDEHYPELANRVYLMDFLKADLSNILKEQSAIIGNFPYNISSQIYFRVLEHRDKIPVCVGMIQKEVAERICSKEGSKIYGILSVLIQAFYDAEYLFEVSPKVFNPPPKVWSAVIRLKRNSRKNLPCDEALFFSVVKRAFQTRRKTLRNALKSLNLSDSLRAQEVFNKRAEQLSVEEFITLTSLIEKDAV